MFLPASNGERLSGSQPWDDEDVLRLLGAPAVVAIRAISCAAHVIAALVLADTCVDYRTPLSVDEAMRGTGHAAAVAVHHHRCHPPDPKPHRSCSAPPSPTYGKCLVPALACRVGAFGE